MGIAVPGRVLLTRMPSGPIIRDCEFLLNRQRLRYTLLRVPRRRHVHLIIEDGGELQVRAPYRYSQTEAEREIRSHADWVLRELELARQKAAKRPALESGSKLPLLDDFLTLRVNPVQQVDLFENAGLVGIGEIKRHDRELRVRTLGDDPPSLRALLEKWYRRQARDSLIPLLYKLASEIGVQPTRVSIRDQKTCWGSCTEKGSISLNWRLMLLPLKLAEYVLVHELCHLQILDHSPSFWAKVEQRVPDFKRRRTKLKEAQHSLAF